MGPSDHPANSIAFLKTSTEIRIRELLGRGDSITYPCLVGLRRRGLRNGNWRHLDSGQRALFRCAMWLAKARGRICNAKLMVQVLRVALRLLETVRGSILRAGRNRSTGMLANYSQPGGVFSWAPRVSEWLSEAGYVWYLGILEVNP
jgi:hypothetical protein